MIFTAVSFPHFGQIARHRKQPDLFSGKTSNTFHPLIICPSFFFAFRKAVSVMAGFCPRFAQDRQLRLLPRRRERELERRLRKLEDGNGRYPYYPQEESRYIDPYPIPRYPDVEYGRKMPQIGFSQSEDWDKRSGQYEHGGADSRSIKMPRKHLTHDEAEEWCDSMVNADGTKGCHWTLEQTQDVAKQRNITCDPNDFWAVMNMMYSDYCQVAKRQSVDTPGFYADMAKAFLEDADAADGKAYLYWDCIADK